MLIALNRDLNRVTAEKADRNLTYFCPMCNSELSLKKGSKKIHHFAHKINSTCELENRDKSDWHIEWQESFGIDNSEKITTIGEYTRISDINLNNVYIEFQHSPITYKEIRKRTRFYTLDNRKLFWIFDLRDQYDSGKIYLHSKKSSSYFVFKWNNHNKSLRAADDRNSEMLFQLEDDLIIKVKWMALDSRLEIETLRVFAGDVLNKQQTIEHIKDRVDNNWLPTNDFEKSFEYQLYKERVSDLDNGFIV
jgi:competence CoiA-like predicted nuclease